GKSTTMKMLLGLTHPSEGSVTIFGQEMSARNRLALLKDIGSLIESPSAYGHLNARDNLRIAAELKGVPYADIGRVLEIVHLEKERTRLVRQFSLGMRQRLGIAQALLGRPRLLILDEPTNGLDPEGIHEMRLLIHSIPKAYGATVLVSSHLLGEMEQMIDHVGIIHHGRLLWQGTLEALQRERGGEVIVTRRSRTLEEIFLGLIGEKETRRGEVGA
ncbi:MAG: ABC transporter ATP-binding protein, partial [Candidatus Ventricola sp.]